MDVFLGILAGLSTGTAVILYFWLKQSELERKLLINKVLVRDGQARIFPDEMITGKKPEKASAPIEIKSPYRQGLQNLQKQTELDKKRDSGSNLPNTVKAKIKEAAGVE